MTESKIRNIFRGYSNSVSGTTTATYLVAENIKMLGYKDVSIAITNTIAANTLNFRIIGYTHIAIPKEIVEATPLTALATKSYIIADPYNLITIEVRDANLGDHATFTIEYCLRS